MESARDQCRKENCRGCEHCGGGHSNSGVSCYKCDSDIPAPAKTLQQATSKEIREELTRRRNERRKQHKNAKTNTKIQALQKEIERLKKELE